MTLIEVGTKTFILENICLITYQKTKDNIIVYTNDGRMHILDGWEATLFGDALRELQGVKHVPSDC